MARMRTVAATIKYFKEQDPNTCISEYFLRSKLKSGELKTVKVGNEFLLNLDLIEEYLSNPSSELEEKSSQYGQLRKFGLEDRK